MNSHCQQPETLLQFQETKHKSSRTAQCPVQHSFSTTDKMIIREEIKSKFRWIVNVHRQYGNFCPSELQVRLCKDHIEVMGKQSWRPVVICDVGLLNEEEQRLSFEIRRPLVRPVDESSVVAFMTKDGVLYVYAQEIDLRVPALLQQLFNAELQKQAERRQETPLVYPVVMYQPTNLTSGSTNILRDIFDIPSDSPRCVHLNETVVAKVLDSKHKDESIQPAFGSNFGSSFGPIGSKPKSVTFDQSKPQVNADKNDNSTINRDMETLLQLLSLGCRKKGVEEPMNTQTSVSSTTKDVSNGRNFDMQTLLQRLSFGCNSIQNRR